MIEAAQHGQVAVVEQLWKDGAQVELLNHDETSLLKAAIHAGSERIVELLLNAGAQIKERSQSGKKPAYLPHAWNLRHRQMVKVVLERDPEASSIPIGLLLNAALSLASEKGQVDRVNELLDHGADSNGETSITRSPLASAAAQGQDRNVELFLERGDSDIRLKTYSDT